MKVAISYPPLQSKKGTPALTQNRQFQWLRSPTLIYPVIPAYAATLLKLNGCEVFWDDAIAEGINYYEWLARLEKEKPDIIAFETKTPVIKMHWKIINELKAKSQKLKASKFVLMGDHVSANPKESLENSQVDFVLVGGNYDFLLLKLINNLEKQTSRVIGDDCQGNLSNLPLIDRELTKWKLYAYKNGNFKYKPGAYMMSGRDCWWGKCSFCAWTILFPRESYQVIPVELALKEVENLINLGAREIMEDSGTLPVGEWLQKFCEGLIEKGYNKKIKIDCNMRLNAIKDLETWKLMKRAGFRMILFGLESANQETLDKINKNLNVSEIEPSLKICKDAGLEPHITAMIGYPWETKEMAQKTLDLAKDLFKKGFVDTLQATLIMPYPGTPLYKYCEENNLLLTKDYNRFDQDEMVIKTPLTNTEAKKLVRDLYKSFFSWEFILRKISKLRTGEDFKILGTEFWKWLGKIFDFSR